MKLMALCCGVQLHRCYASAKHFNPFSVALMDQSASTTVFRRHISQLESESGKYFGCCFYGLQLSCIGLGLGVLI